jgi:hypothetical protein
MALPDRTLCWVEGPPWDRECQPVGSLLPAEETALDLTLLRRRLERLSNRETGAVIGVLMSVISDRGVDLRSFLPNLVDAVLGDGRSLPRWTAWTGGGPVETDQVVLVDLTPAEVRAVCDFFYDRGVVGEAEELALRSGRRKLEAALEATS